MIPCVNDLVEYPISTGTYVVSYFFAVSIWYTCAFLA